MFLCVLASDDLQDWLIGLSVALFEYDELFH